MNFEGITPHDLRHTLLNDPTASLLPPPKKKGNSHVWTRKFPKFSAGKYPHITRIYKITGISGAKKIHLSFTFLSSPLKTKISLHVFVTC